MNGDRSLPVWACAAVDARAAVRATSIVARILFCRIAHVNCDETQILSFDKSRNEINYI